MENFGKFMTGLVLSVISPIINGFVITKLWMWFIVPIFNLDPLRIVEAIGIAALIGFLSAKYTKTEDDYDWFSDMITRFLYVVILALYALLFGWIVSLFM